MTQKKLYSRQEMTKIARRDREDFESDRYAYISNEIMRSELSHAAKLIYAHLAGYAGNDGECFPSYPTIQRELKFGRTTIYWALKELEKVHIIRILRNSGRANSYVLTHIISEPVPVQSQDSTRSVSGQVPSNRYRLRTGPVPSQDSKINNIRLRVIYDDFETFWDQYHSITNMPKTDKDAALKRWKKLNQEDQKKAIENIQLFNDSIKEQNFKNKAWTYLDGKLFNNEFKNPIKTIPRPK